MFELELFKRILVANKVEAKQLYKIFLNMLLLKNETFSQMFIKGTEENLSAYYLSLQKDYLTFLSQYFIRKGSKSKVENLFRKFFFKLKKRKNPSRRWAKKTWRSFLKCKYNAMYYIRLKIRKRRRRVKYRVTYLESYRWLKKSALPLAKTVKESKLRTFSDAFYKEFILLRSGKSGITTKRNEYHKLAYMRAPYSWKRLRKSKQKRQKSLTWRFFKVWNRKIRKRKWSVWLKKVAVYTKTNRLKNFGSKKRFNKWVSQYLVNQENFIQNTQNVKKSEKFNNNSVKKTLKNTLLKENNLFLLTKNVDSLNKFVKKDNFFGGKVRLFLRFESKHEIKPVLALVKISDSLFSSHSQVDNIFKSQKLVFNSNFESKKGTFVLKKFGKTKSNVGLIFGKTNTVRREKFVKKYLLPKKGVSKIDLSKHYPLINNPLFFNNLIRKRINFNGNSLGGDKKLLLIQKSIYIKKLKRLNAFNFFSTKASQFISTSSLVIKGSGRLNLNINFSSLKKLLKGKNLKVGLNNTISSGLKDKSNYDHSFKTLNFFSVVILWKFLESRLLKNLTLNEYKKIEKDTWRKKKYQFIKKMFYYIKMVYRDLYKI